MAHNPTRAEVVHPSAISLRDVWPWALLGIVLLALFYLVGVEGGATSVTPGRFIHEMVHDGRHLLSFACH